MLLAIAFWRGATNLQGHTRAAAQALADAQPPNARAAAPKARRNTSTISTTSSPASARPCRSSYQPGTAAVGKTLAEIKLRGLTGATVLAIQRGDESVLVPSGHERLQAGDILAIAGTHDAVDAAKELLAAKK